MAQIPPTMQRAVRGDKNPLDVIEQSLRNAIFGQERAIEAIIRVLNRARFGFAAGNARRPRATLLFLGPTGVGKTETARRLAQLLRPDGEAFLKIDCSLFSQGHEVSALVGAPPSYVGRDQKPLLNPDIIEQENSVVLFDEIEKGQPELWNLLLQIMEDGEILLLNGGRRVSFSNSVVILTTNVGAKEMVDFLDQRTIGFRTSRQDVEATGRQIYQIGFEALQKVFQPEWINRIDEIVAFRPLSSEVLRQVLDRMVKEANQQYQRHGIHVTLTEEACEYVLRKGFEPRFGARPLRQQLLKLIEAPLADLMASGGIPAGSRVLVVATGIDRHGEALEFYHEPAPELLVQAQELRAAEVGRSMSDGPQQPSVGLTTDHGHTMEHSAGPFGARGPRATPRRNDERR
ncbi:MAG: ATP-dependent Clp protease ATP-binding subunit [Roseiflexus castenholzii]|jgi:ATP-dependent Clp protease ATP-binding subunit ClpA|uniref:ATPase AAA-2 domain protein n=1 Tax=Roseiflexus castenholzii (strain DSM 13941 / HLO8) TaxID=383372 RepID=A7NS30_ROSCS|nr:AAA family ATPase [Roseiflexus castenholzii]ABU60376.1 ATPase AAA-2 domain protein [Roseiflexus castenholzii DSM 13941]PMP76937.1 MAG: ATP-dependent Clp protease ATP-binding subunit [Roseiflexus castenholzii]